MLTVFKLARGLERTIASRPTKVPKPFFATNFHTWTKNDKSRRNHGGSKSIFSSTLIRNFEIAQQRGLLLDAQKYTVVLLWEWHQRENS